MANQNNPWASLPGGDSKEFQDTWSRTVLEMAWRLEREETRRLLMSFDELVVELEESMVHEFASNQVFVPEERDRQEDLERMHGVPTPATLDWWWAISFVAHQRLKKAIDGTPTEFELEASLIQSERLLVLPDHIT